MNGTLFFARIPSSIKENLEIELILSLRIHFNHLQVRFFKLSESELLNTNRGKKMNERILIAAKTTAVEHQNGRRSKWPLIKPQNDDVPKWPLVDDPLFLILSVGHLRHTKVTLCCNSNRPFNYQNSRYHSKRVISNGR